jgi:hypothetical protein
VRQTVLQDLLSQFLIRQAGAFDECYTLGEDGALSAQDAIDELPS